ncbi:hypothetical protein OH491_21465 [Termitidicoccus mucosus]
MRKSKDPDIIELTAKKPVFSWAIVFGFIAAWVVTLVLAILLRASVVRLLLPLIAALFVIYLGVCTILYLKNKK